MDDTRQKANNIRISIVRMLNSAGSGHTGGSLGMADVFSVLYAKILKDPHSANPDRDRFILSNGHINPVWYAALAEFGFIPKQELSTLRKIGSRLQGHPSSHDLKLVEIPTGSLGQGIGAAAGLALGLKMDDSKSKVYVGLGDGEMQEGSVWEALMAAAHYKLNNLVAFLDRNSIQQGGKTEDMLALEPLKEKVVSFGWHCIEADGHDHTAIEDSLKTETDKPLFIIFNTHLGKGVDFVLDNFKWHGKAMTDDELTDALKQLEAQK